MVERGQATGDNIIRGMRFACWITKATDTHTENMLYLLLVRVDSGYANAPECYVVRTSPFLCLYWNSKDLLCQS